MIDALPLPPAAALCVITILSIKSRDASTVEATDPARIADVRCPPRCTDANESGRNGAVAL